MMLNSRMTQSIRELSYEVREDTETPATRYSDEVRDDAESRGAWYEEGQGNEEEAGRRWSRKI